MKTSEKLAEILGFMHQCEVDYKYFYEKVNEEDKLTQDILHKMELGDLKYEERAKLATRLQTNRRDRRHYKDKAEELAPLADFINKPETQRTINLLKNVLGEVRKAEKSHENRVYIPRTKGVV